MANRITVTIACDGCGTQRQDYDRSGHRVVLLEELLTAVGWECDRRANRHLCPHCVARRDAGGEARA